MKTAGLPLVAISAALVSLALFSTGCPGMSGTDGGPMDSGMDAGMTDSGMMDSGMDSGMDAGPLDAGPIDAGPMDAGPTDAGTVTCADYCTTIAANCTGGNAQYASMADCLGFCAVWPAGMPTDQTGASLACHNYHAGAAAGNAGVHCRHAGPSGGSLCGSDCENYCLGELAICPANYGSAGACATACAAFDAGVQPYNDSFTAGNDDFCRIYHLTAAAAGAGAASTHCPHTRQNPTAFCN